MPEKHYLFYGENTFEKEEVIQKLTNKLAPDFQKAIFSLDDCLESIENFALLKEQFWAKNFDGQKYLFHLKKAEFLINAHKKFSPNKSKKINLAELHKLTNNSWAQLVLFLMKALEYQPTEHLLLLNFDSDKLSVENFLPEIFKKHATLTHFPKEKKPQNITAWAKSKLIQNELNYQPQVVQTLIELCNSDKRRIFQEIQKFKMLEKTLTPQIIAQTIEMSEISPFVFLDNVILKNKFFFKQKFTCFFETLSVQDIQRIFALLVNEFRRILKIKWLTDAGNQQQIPSLLKIPDWLIKKYIIKANCFHSNEIENILQHLQKNDLTIKYAGQNAGVLLSQFCLQVVENEFRLF